MTTHRPAALAPFLALGSAAMLVAMLMAALSLVVARPAAGSSGSDVRPDPVQVPAWCEDLRLGSGDHCELRAISSTVRGNEAFVVSGMRNGSITVEGWTGSDVRITARVVARQAGSARAAADLVESVQVRPSAGRVEVDGPRGGVLSRASWSADLRIQVPLGTDLDLSTSNGPIRVTGVEGGVQARSSNGAVTLQDVRGSVRAETSNGAVTVVLATGPGAGDAVTLRTSNGPINLHLAETANARLEARTSNGRITSELPLEMQGRRQNEATGVLGQGEGRIELRTSNGAIRIHRNR
jgi:hypothetical protein